MATTNEIKSGSAYVELTLKDSRFAAGLSAAAARLKKFGSLASQIGDKMLQVAAGAALPAGLATKTFMGFEDQLKAVQAVTGATGESFKRLYEQAKELGRTTSFTAAEVGAGMLNLARAGFSPAEIQQAIAGVMDLSRATGTDLALSSDIAAGTLRAFSLEAREMTRVSDVLVATANGSAQTLEDLGESMKYVAPIAEEYGLSLEETSKALGVLANMQIKGSMAGTSMRMLMTQLADPGVQARIERMGVAVKDLQGNLRTDLGAMLLELGRAMQGMGSGERIALLKDLFDQRAMGAAAKLAKADFPALAKAIDEAAGKADATARVMDSGLGGAFRMMTSAIEGVAIALGEALSGQLSGWMQTIQEISLEIVEWIKNHQALLGTIVKVVGAVAAAGVAAKALGIVVGLVSAAFTTAAGAATAFGAVCTFLAAHPIVLILSGLAMITYAVAGAFREAEDETLKYSEAAKKAREAGDAARQADMKRIDRLEELAKKQKLSSAEMTEAQRIIKALNATYGDLGIRLDATTGKLEGVAGGAKLASAEMRKLAEAQLMAEFREAQANQQAEMAKGLSASKYTGLSDLLFGQRDTPPEAQAHFAAMRAEAARAERIIARLKELYAGNKAAIGGETPEERKLLEEAEKKRLQQLSEEQEKLNASLQWKLHEARIALIEDEEARALEAIEAKYAKEMEEAKNLTAYQRGMLSLTKAAEKQAVAQKYDAERKKNAQRMGDDLERAKIEATVPEGVSRQLALLDLERQQALRDAEKEGLDPAQVNRLYDLRAEAIANAANKPEAPNIPAPQGTFSAMAAQLLGLGESSGERTAKATEETARNTRRLVEKFRREMDWTP